MDNFKLQACFGVYYSHFQTPVWERIDIGARQPATEETSHKLVGISVLTADSERCTVYHRTDQQAVGSEQGQLGWGVTLQSL